MADIMKRHADKLSAATLILMLVIPFFLYAAAWKGADIFIWIFLGLMALVMLLAMKA